MKKILLLDTSIGTSNLGDHIIMECVREELEPILRNSFVYDMPTHLPAFSTFAVFRNSSVVQNYSNCELKFAGGSNLLVKDLKTHYPQWNIHPWNSKPLRGIITVGVGAGAGDYTNNYTRKLYQKVLSREYYHSVRDERSKEYVESLGLKAINTGCVTMWLLTPDFCEQIPRAKASRVVFTLTACSEPDILDQDLIDILTSNYEKVYFWPQGDKDEDYLKHFSGTEGISILPPKVKTYDVLLSENDLDYVGTRLHGGIYAMRHKKRAIIIAIDERAQAINQANHLNCIEKNEIPLKLENMICSEIQTQVHMPFDQIKLWKEQFITHELL